MEKKIIHLTTREQLNVYMSPVRQELLRRLRLAEGPQTAKALSDKLKISPSSVQHHLKKLLELGAVEVDHRAVINGITATYYRETRAEVRVGLDRDDGLRDEREALATDIVNRTLQSFFRDARKVGAGMTEEEAAEYGDFFSGVAHLAPEEQRELRRLIRAFLDEHDCPAPGRTQKWEYVVLAHRMEETP